MVEIDSISKTMIYTGVIYMLVLIYGLNFIFTSIAYDYLKPDFWLITLIVIMPLILYVLYFLRGNSQFLSSKELWLKRLIFVFTMIAALFIAIVIIPLTY